jgi:hypothetical protein
MKRRRGSWLLDRVFGRDRGLIHGRVQGHDRAARLGALDRDDPAADATRVAPLRLPCRTCRRGSIMMVEPGFHRARRVPCPACSGTGYV